MTTKRPIRCAIYTRKSSEEGLDQSFNSLHAQREACEAYIASQKHEGWHAVSTHYDDGGFSGGSMERPALQSLLSDIAAGKVNTVVVYKVDRLTRSLADFAKIIEVFDAKGVSFVSVTQQFNTTTSMGRLTLNVLLSFAQFEREVTGERIRDKVAASKKKGMWMGGYVPLGYDIKDRRLVINPAEAKAVREIFQQYLKLGRVSALKGHLKASGILSKLRKSVAKGTTGGKPYSRGALYHILKNRLYIGEVAHRGNVYPGEHEAIIDRETWDKVAALLAQNNQGQRRRGKTLSSSLLTGILFDADGNRYTPTHAVKKGKRYRYYTSQAVIQGRKSPTSITRIPARELERVVVSRIGELLSTPTEMSTLFSDAGVPAANLRAGLAAAQKLAARLDKMPVAELASLVQGFLRRVVLQDRKAAIEMAPDALIAAIFPSEPERTCESSLRDESDARPDPITIGCEFQPHHWSNELRLVIPGAGGDDPTPLVMTIARARLWYEQFVAGELYNLHQLAARAKFSAAFASRIFRYAALSPQIVEHILEGKGNARRLEATPQSRPPLGWQGQSAWMSP